MAEKVVVYITRGRELLIFDHLEAEPDIPMPQVPKGTLEPGEDPLAGALREACSHTVSHGELDQGFVYHHRFMPIENLNLAEKLSELLPQLKERL